MPDGLPAGYRLLRTLDRAAIEALIPERPPSLFVDRATAAGDAASERLEWLEAHGAVPAVYCDGHFPGRPVAPFVVMGRVVTQAAALLASLAAAGHGGAPSGGRAWLTVGVDHLRAGTHGVVLPDEPLVAQVRLVRGGARAARISGTLYHTMSRETVLVAEEIRLVAVEV